MLAPWREPFRAGVEGIGAPVVVACSGGADSVALLVLAVDAGLHPVAVHVDHALRDGSEREADGVAALAASLGAEFRAARASVERGPNLEARARDRSLRRPGASPQRGRCRQRPRRPHRRRPGRDRVAERAARCSGVGARGYGTPPRARRASVAVVPARRHPRPLCGARARRVPRSHERRPQRSGESRSATMCCRSSRSSRRVIWFRCWRVRPTSSVPSPTTSTSSRSPPGPTPIHRTPACSRHCPCRSPDARCGNGWARRRPRPTRSSVCLRSPPGRRARPSSRAGASCGARPAVSPSPKERAEPCPEGGTA